MVFFRWNRHRVALKFSGNEITGALGDSVTVLPIVVAIAVLTKLSLTSMLLWFGGFQIIWGLYYGVPLSVEPMKALAGLLLAGAMTAGEFLVAGLIAGIVLLGIGVTDSISRIDDYVGEPVIRGVQLAVALILARTGIDLGLATPGLAVAGVLIAVVVIAVGYWNLTAMVVLVVGALVVGIQQGFPAWTVPTVTLLPLGVEDLSATAIEGAIAQLAMTIGNAAIATALLVDDFFDRSISPDELTTSMGAMNLLAPLLGGIPMCHGSGGVAGKYAFGARSPMSNVILGIVYIGLGVLAVHLLVAYPKAMLGVILVLVALELGRASLRTDRYLLALLVGFLGALTNVGLALVVGIAVDQGLKPRLDGLR